MSKNEEQKKNESEQVKQGSAALASATERATNEQGAAIDKRNAQSAANRVEVQPPQQSARMRELEREAMRSGYNRDRGALRQTQPKQEIPPLPEQQEGKPERIVPRVMTNPAYVPENNPNPFPAAAAKLVDPSDPRQGFISGGQERSPGRPVPDFDPADARTHGANPAETAQLHGARPVVTPVATTEHPNASNAPAGARPSHNP